ncbi:MAG: hypothetical protein WCW31_00115 [Patescibacteria group bacterium]|jgi:hypothetical protein
MSELQGKKILLLQQRRWATNIGHFLAIKLQAQGCRLAALTLKRSAHEFILSQTEVRYDLVIGNDEIMDDPKKYLGNDNITLKQVCDDLGIDSVWPIANALRNHVRTYRDKFYYGYMQNVSDEGIADYVKAVYKYTVLIFNEFSPDIIISPNFVSLPHIMLRLYAAKKGIKMFGLTDSKVKHVNIFTYGEYDDRGPFFDRLDDLNNGKATSDNLEKAISYISDFRQQFRQPTYAVNPDAKKTLYRAIRNELSPYKQIWSWYTKPQKNYLKSTGITLDYRPPRIILRDFYYSKYYRHAAKKFPYEKIENIDKCIYFPLQFQPEISIEVMAPYFCNQLEVARQIAMSLPDDYTLMVKEHPAMVGLRPPSSMIKLSRTPNVKVIDYHVPSDVALKKADLVISPNSTALVEASFYHKPAIQLGNLGTTQMLPNVVRHTDMTTLSGTIKRLLTTDFKTEDYEMRLRNYIAAAYDTGFSIDYTAIWEEGNKKELETLLNIYIEEVRKNIK